MQNIQNSTDVGAEVLLTVVREFVAALKSARNDVADDDTIPDLIRTHVINRTRWLWLCEFPQLRSMQTKEREKLNDSAQEFLTKIIEEQLQVEPPEAAESDTPTTGNWGSETKFNMRTSRTLDDSEET